MAVTSRRLAGTEINNWTSLAVGPEAAITDTYVRNAGEADAYISADGWGNQTTLKGGQSLSFDGLPWADIQKLSVSDDGNGTVIEILAISR